VTCPATKQPLTHPPNPLCGGGFFFLFFWGGNSVKAAVGGRGFFFPFPGPIFVGKGCQNPLLIYPSKKQCPKKRKKRKKKKKKKKKKRLTLGGLFKPPHSDKNAMGDPPPTPKRKPGKRCGVLLGKKNLANKTKTQNRNLQPEPKWEPKQNILTPRNGKKNFFERGNPRDGRKKFFFGWVFLPPGGWGGFLFFVLGGGEGTTTTARVGGVCFVSWGPGSG